MFEHESSNTSTSMLVLPGPNELELVFPEPNVIDTGFSSAASSIPSIEATLPQPASLTPVPPTFPQDGRASCNGNVYLDGYPVYDSYSLLIFL
uniref:Uncharacterized protein n=1 Tax=Steinernema glaseri TaxID=37863 RepID=A0A1I7YHG1_9BILA